MYRLWLLAILACGSVAFSHAASATPKSPAGAWLTANQQAIIVIVPCGPDFCGRIAGIVQNTPGSSAPLDWQGKPQCGLTILHTHAADTGATPKWRGTILDPRDGSVYQASLTLDDHGNLRLHGYLALPLLGQTEVWHPFNSQALSGCAVSPAALRAGA
ncbi:MAG TPA: DUF2147 domain-containing protein [Acidocella sp.]|nr:DUF2147 domain-containing protein [Acidocella sp.]